MTIELAPITDAILDLLGFEDKHAVRSITIKPHTVTVELYARNENGAMYTNPDTNTIVTVIRTFSATT